MHVHRYRHNYAEDWLESARDQVIYGVEKMTESGGLGRFEYFTIAVGVKLRCLAAAGIAFVHIIGSWFLAVWSSITRYLLHKSTIEQNEEAWDTLQESIDVLMNALTGLFDSNAVLTAADRGNIRRICDLGLKMQDVMAHPDVNPATRKEIETWYKNAKVFVRKGGGEAKKEMSSLADALDHLQKTPATAPDRLLGWRWEKQVTGTVAVEKIRGIRWKPPIPATGSDDLSKRVWTRKTS
ncbi:MAG: hypothetical protein Q8K75_05240 [Chlamydiales bacterium]|nr:hypothetical protein [Chlamydiales bacterium]